MKSKWPGRFNIGLNTHSMVYQQLGVGTSTSYGCKTFFSSWTNPKKTDLKKQQQRNRFRQLQRWTHYVGSHLGSNRGAKKTTRAKSSRVYSQLHQVSTVKGTETVSLYYMEMGF